MESAIKNILLGLAILQSAGAQAYDNTITHRELTRTSVSSSMIANRGYLSRNLGEKFTLEHDSKIKKFRVFEWFQEGSDFEDKAPENELYSDKCRAANHFHNPLKPWNAAEMNDGRLTFRGARINQHCENREWEYADRKSNLTWATGFIGPAPEGEKQKIERQEWGWDKARESYQLALSSPLTPERDTGFADTFRSLGHVIHLIQDGAQPAHVRNDFESHLTWTNLKLENFWEDWFGSQYEYYVKIHTRELVQAVIPQKPEIENPSLTDFWDTDIYQGDNPSDSLALGITEIVNANYFSERTLPRKVWKTRSPGVPSLATQYDEADFHKFPHPTLTNEDARVCNGPFFGDRPEKVRRYIVRKGEGDCTEANYIAAAEVMAVPSLANEPAQLQVGNIEDLEFSLDPKIYQAYAEKLLPLAIGYSSALIDYFFRGELGVVHHPDGLIIKNRNDEEMAKYADKNNTEIGKISIYYDDLSGRRSLLAGYELESTLLPGDRTPVIEFEKPQDNITPGRYIIVFEGRLGKEKGAIIGKIVSPRIYYVSQRLDAVSATHIYKIIRMNPDGSDKTTIFDNQDANFLIGKMDLSPDSSQLVFQAENGDDTSRLYLLDTFDLHEAETPQPVLLTQGRWATWSVDGDSIIFQRGIPKDLQTYRGGSELYKIDIDDSTVTQLTSGSRTDMQPAWSPDGAKIAYVTNSPDEIPELQGDAEVQCGNGISSIEYMNISGEHEGSITDCLVEYWHPGSVVNGVQRRYSNIRLPTIPAWSPDGMEVMFLVEYYFEDEGAYYFNKPFKIDVQSQQETALFDTYEPDSSPYLGASSWSLDSSEIATTYYFLEDMYSSTDIMMMDADTGEFIRNLTTDGGVNDSYPVYGY